MPNWLWCLVRVATRDPSGLAAASLCLRSAKIARQPESCIGGYRPLTVDNLVDAAGVHTNIFGETILRDAQGVQELLKQNLPGVDWRCVVV